LVRVPLINRYNFCCTDKNLAIVQTIEPAKETWNLKGMVKLFIAVFEQACLRGCSEINLRST
jgi:hypothetical protein